MSTTAIKRAQRDLDAALADQAALRTADPEYASKHLNAAYRVQLAQERLQAARADADRASAKELRQKAREVAAALPVVSAGSSDELYGLLDEAVELFLAAATAIQEQRQPLVDSYAWLTKVVPVDAPNPLARAVVETDRDAVGLPLVRGNADDTSQAALAAVAAIAAHPLFVNTLGKVVNSMAVVLDANAPRPSFAVAARLQSTKLGWHAEQWLTPPADKED